MKKRKQPQSKPSLNLHSQKPQPVRDEWHYTTEGVEFVLDWDKFPLQGFVFIPCMETDKVCISLRREAAKRAMSLSLKVGIRNGYWGVGVWRTR